MWLFTETGFVSAVTHRDDDSLMMVRARDKKSLEPLAVFGGTKIDKTLTADYPWRTVVPKTVLKEWLCVTVDDAQYDNFKSRVTKIRGVQFVDALHEVWAVMMQVEEYNLTSKKRKWWQDHDDMDEELF